MAARVSYITLGVADLSRSLFFYQQALGFLPRKITSDMVFFASGALTVALCLQQQLNQLTGLVSQPANSGTVVLSLNVETQAKVDEHMLQAQAAGGQVSQAAQAMPWGGYAGFVADPDGHIWEIVWNPNFE